jgi:hypothetical protein
MEFYRARLSITVPMAYEEDCPSTVSFFRKQNVRFSTYCLIKETPKGHWIQYGTRNNLKGPKKWVSKTSKKRFAYPTKEEALFGLQKRTERRMNILSSQLSDCKDGLLSIKVSQKKLDKDEDI